MSESDPDVKESPEPELPEPPTEEQSKEAEKLLQQASVARIRGQSAIAERALKEAAEIAPGSALVRAALGDELWGRGQFKNARVEYQLAHLLDPTNVNYEVKWAEAILGSTGDPLALSHELRDSYASGKSAAIFSLILPGLGNIVIGQIQKGIIMISIWVLGWTWAVLTPHGLSGIPHLLGFKAKVDTFNYGVMFPLALITFVWFWAAFSTASKAKQYTPKKIERPVPPGEGRIDI